MRRFTLALVALALAVGTAGCAAGDDEEQSEATTARPTGRGAFVAGTQDGRVVLLGADGDEIRTISDLAPEDASNGFAVSPGARHVYLDRGGKIGCSRSRIVRLDLTRRAARRVVRGSQPAVSPDGRRLAYVTCSDDVPDQLVVRDLDSDEERRWPAPGHVLVGPSWAPDSRHVAVQLNDAVGQPIAVVDTRTPSSIDEVPQVRFEVTDNVFWAGYRSATEFLALVAPGGEAGAAAGVPLQVAAIDAATGRTLRTLFELDALCCFAQLAADAGGRVLAADVTNMAGLTDDLFVWTDDGSAPRQVASGIRLAGWIPRPRP